jgi:hypothetical protein
MIVAPSVAPDTDLDEDCTMEFIAESLLWNFWPRMTSTPGGAKRTMEFRLHDGDAKVRISDPRTHERLRDFVAAMDVLRQERADEANEFQIDRSIECLRPIKTLGRLVIQKGASAPVTLPRRAVPQGASVTAGSVNHVALMRNAELVVKYLAGPQSVNGRVGYSGVFQCAIDVDGAFRRSEPPTHDDWSYKFIPTDSGHDKRFVNVALNRIGDVCREAAGYTGSISADAGGDGVPLGEFADSLARLMPGFDGPGARRETPKRSGTSGRRRTKPGRTLADDVAGHEWVAGEVSIGGESNGSAASGGEEAGESTAPTERRVPVPQSRAGGDPTPVLASDGTAVVQYPFELRAFNETVRLRATVEVMTNDGGQVEADAPIGYEPPVPRAWVGPDGTEHIGAEPVIGPENVDGRWLVEVPLRDTTMMRVDITPEVV